MAKSRLMAMIWFVLRDEYYMRFGNVREVGDARWDSVFRVEKFWMPHGTWAIEPRVNEYAECAWRLRIT